MESFKEIKTYYSREDTANLSEYEIDHKPRLDYLISDLGLKHIKDSKICDFGAGGGYILKNLDPSNELIAVDGFKIEDELTREQYNLDAPYADDFISKHGQVDVAFSFEMFEHLTNPYNFIFELKKVLKEDGLLYFSVPHELTQHNTFYPGLIYPVQNLIEFFNQMSFSVQQKKLHRARFVQNVLILKNRSWDNVRMKWPKQQESFQGQPPHVQVNL